MSLLCFIMECEVRHMVEVKTYVWERILIMLGILLTIFFLFLIESRNYYDYKKEQKGIQNLVFDRKGE